MVIVTLIFLSFLVICSIAVGVAEAFAVLPTGNEKVHNVRLSMAKDDAESKKGYRFGDLTRGLLSNKDGESKEGYQFGDLTRGLLKKVEEESGSEGYKFGDISRWLDKKAKEQASKFTEKADYKFGDISKEVVRRLKDGEYTREDLWLFLKIVATIGINLQPVTSVLPLRVLTELLNMTMEASIAQTVGNKVVTAITGEIDGRMKEMITGDRNYQLGDITKRSVSKWMGKENYEDGDITKIALEKMAATKDDSEKEEILELFDTKSEEDLLEEWDKKLLKDRRENEGLGELKNDESYKDWDEKFLSSDSSK